MATVSRDLPKSPHLDVPKREARALLKDWRARTAEALERIAGRHPRFRKSDAGSVAEGRFLLSDAQLVIAREYGFETWAALKERINANTPARLLLEAIHKKDDVEAAVRILREHPQLLHIPLWSGNWGPPMSHAANLGNVEMIRSIAALGARDFNHALGRAVLQGKIEAARWLHANGAMIGPGEVMGPCETLNPSGLKLLLELGARIEDAEGNRLAPLALALETYCRKPADKHAVLKIFEEQGYTLPDTPMMAVHRGDLARLKEFLKRERDLIHRRFRLTEIYPPELGCAKDGRSGMHWTPIDGTTLLHIAVDYDDVALFEFLLEHGADVNAAADVDVEGFGGHTPIYNAVVSHGRNQAAMAQRLLERGASVKMRANLRKFLDWCETPRWHEAREVTPGEWARTFADKGWINAEALSTIESRE